MKVDNRCHQIPEHQVNTKSISQHELVMCFVSKSCPRHVLTIGRVPHRRFSYEEKADGSVSSHFPFQSPFPISSADSFAVGSGGFGQYLSCVHWFILGPSCESYSPRKDTLRAWPPNILPRKLLRIRYSLESSLEAVLLITFVKIKLLEHVNFLYLPNPCLEWSCKKYCWFRTKPLSSEG
jgi:hypothetical protein